MSIESKVFLIRAGAFIVLCGLFWVCWWMDYRWKRGPQGIGFFKSNGQPRMERYNPNYDGPVAKESFWFSRIVGVVVVGIAVLLCFVKL